MSEKEKNLFGDDVADESTGMIKLSGSIEHIIYQNEENGYTVADFGTDDDDLITITGIMPYIAEGDALCVYGEWRHNPKYGRQFSVTEYEKYMPANASAILRYLSSGAIKGIGKKTAVKIVEQFGDETLEVLENHPDWLSDIHGISLKKAKEICEDFKQKAGIRSAMMFFRDFFGAATTVKIYKRWGSACIDVAKENPYRLCDEIDGIGFERADGMAIKLGLNMNSTARLMAGIAHVLKHNAAQNGHVCLPREKLAAASASLLGANDESIQMAIDDMIAIRRLKYSVFDGVTYLYDSYAYDCETYIAQKLDLLDKICPSVDVADANLFIEREQSKVGFEYALLQKKAIYSALECGVMLLTGGPGTGKTTIVKALLDIFSSMDMKVALAAPTGRAAKRLSEATSHEAKTIHRLLEFEYSTEAGERSGFRRNENDTLEEHVIIIDESSMIDNILMCNLLKAIKPGARLILIGDADQLPSIGAGNILRDLVESGKFATIQLNEIFRQAQESLIVTNAHRINHGDLPILNVKDNDFFFLPRATDEDIAMTVSDLCRTRLPRTYGKETEGGIQVISPSRKGTAGTENLNVLLQNALNPKSDDKKEYVHRDRVFREGDKVMQIKNNYELEWYREDDSEGMGIFNGDIGTVIKVDHLNQCLRICFEDRTVNYDFTLLEELEHAYAITVHKSQGCEYPFVIIPLYNAPIMLLTKNLFYTAVTRAKRMVILVGRAEVAQTMVQNSRIGERYTCLKQRLLTY
ncbi:MAG: ATP-dependent RecD-like DNA helicase [Ruminococcaceae bacterium]|nr:ATP-dependent RecD-like DNA helicase [Oscillospiraceae bacterium]